MIELTNFDELIQPQNEGENASEIKSVAPTVAETTEKAISEVSLADVKYRVNSDKTYEEQAEDVVNAMSIVHAVDDEGTQQALATGKQSELIGKQQAKVKKAQKDVIDAETEIQKAEYESKTILFDTFNITAHLPKWLQKVLEPILGFFYTLFVLVIKVPCGFCRMLVDGIDGVLVRYEKKDEQTKPKIKVTVIILFVVALAIITALSVLGGLGII